MTPDTFIVGGAAEARSSFAEHMLAFWTREEARNRADGLHDLADRCAAWRDTWRTPYGEQIRWESEP